MSINLNDLTDVIEKKSPVTLKNLSDLELDLDTFSGWKSKWGSSKALWFIKESGTVTLPMKMCVNPVFAECCYDVQCQAFLVDVDNAEFQPVSKEEALKLIYELPQSLSAVRDRELRVESLYKVLENRYVTDNFVSKTHCGKDSTLESWLRYFERTYHPLMVNLIRDLI
ncbi:hypothetical protein [Vibrio owensii]|uniref:hypothetical protein n=1 Tax=Vibrio owensii TaxID=696485 RepID=UPI0018F18993|nr:hypothetical protein [Vibrio owensii]